MFKCLNVSSGLTWNNICDKLSIWHLIFPSCIWHWMVCVKLVAVYMVYLMCMVYIFLIIGNEYSDIRCPTCPMWPKSVFIIRSILWLSLLQNLSFLCHFAFIQALTSCSMILWAILRSFLRSHYNLFYLTLPFSVSLSLPRRERT